MIAIKKIEELSHSDTHFGNKALGLSWLISHGYNVPEGYCLSVSKKNIDQVNKDTISMAIGESFIKRTLIVRSSTMIEDSLSISYAGEFKTVDDVTGNDLVKSIKTVAEHAFSYSTDHNAVGIIIQEQIDSHYSGILFTSNPITGERETGILSIIEGKGKFLVSGQKSGNEYLVRDETVINRNEIFNVKQLLLDKIVCQIPLIRKAYQFPADLEFTTDQNDTLWWLQIRPITGFGIKCNHIEIAGMTYQENEIYEKSNLRYLARKYQLNIGKGWILNLCTESNRNDIKMALPILSPKRLLSLVLIKPVLHNGKIIRKFCNRISIAEEIEILLKKFKKSYLNVEFFINEIFELVYTGIIKHDNAFFYVEIARGHYLPKGITAFSQFQINSNFKITYSRENFQEYFYELSLAGPQKHILNERISINQNNLLNLVRKLSPMLIDTSLVVEFGLMKNDELILIDTVKETNEMSLDPIKTGIISIGSLCGTLISDSELQLKTNIFDQHKKDEIIFPQNSSEKYIISALRPSIELTEFVKTFGKRNIAFVFKENSLINHFSILLREMNIPAICLNLDLSNLFHKKVMLDAESPDFPAHRRLKVI